MQREKLYPDLRSCGFLDKPSFNMYTIIQSVKMIYTKITIQSAIAKNTMGLIKSILLIQALQFRYLYINKIPLLAH